jgi:hypothetical protein
MKMKMNKPILFMIVLAILVLIVLFLGKYKSREGLTSGKEDIDLSSVLSDLSKTIDKMNKDVKNMTDGSLTTDEAIKNMEKNITNIENVYDELKIMNKSKK